LSARAPSTLAIAAVAAAAALWAAAAIVARNLFRSGVDPLELAEARAVTAVAGFALLWIARHGERPRPARPRTIIALGLSIALVNAAYYLAIDHLDVAVAIVLQYTAPALVVLWTAATLRRKPAPEILTALIAAVIGVVLVVELPLGGVGRLDTIGLLFGLASAALFAAYTLLGERAEQAYGPAGAMVRAFAVATVFWIAFQIPRGWPAELFRAANVPEVAFVGVAGTLTPFLLYVWAVRHLRAERTTIVATLEPVLAALFAWVFLDEALSPMQIGGGALVIAAIAVLQIRRKPAVAPAAP
jgi:drug/metabolite transporter (DMT)-like permease